MAIVLVFDLDDSTAASKRDHELGHTAAVLANAPGIPWNIKMPNAASSQPRSKAIGFFIPRLAPRAIRIQAIAKFRLRVVPRKRH